MAADLTLIRRGDSFQLCAGSVIGMLWLQTHLETSTWDLICTGQVRISGDFQERCRRLAPIQAACRKSNSSLAVVTSGGSLIQTTVG